ncbi:phosphoenolpyruvate hydrolase family protein [Bradyrhizobium australafricanum]|uniref:phosphoenolpyruvate hydrolase family protein n=1 Tax=Bradyrhizobium australafricanum TaxID=2821406 RepID=UPI00201C7BED|nr:phosphoenolpyruvate hydrolase family protein [Bradyrhizobium australafricanum]
MAARAAERAGADFVLALNAGRFRAMGGSSPASILPIRNSNEFVAGFGRSEILPSTKLPVFFGACTFDPQLDIDRWLDRISRWGFSGVTNFPVSCSDRARPQKARRPYRWANRGGIETALPRQLSLLESASDTTVFATASRSAFA